MYIYMLFETAVSLYRVCAYKRAQSQQRTIRSLCKIAHTLYWT